MNNRDDLAMRVEQVREDYGDELFDTVLEEADRRAQERAQQQMQKMQKMQQMKEESERQNFHTNKSMVAQQLAVDGINFEQVNNDPVFHGWLSQRNPMTGELRQNKLMTHFNNGDTNSVSSMFKEFTTTGHLEGLSMDQLSSKYHKLIHQKGKHPEGSQEYRDIKREMENIIAAMRG